WPIRAMPSANCPTTLSQSPRQSPPNPNRHVRAPQVYIRSMVIEAIPSVGGEAAEAAADALLRLGELLIARGALDQRSLERARRVALDTAGRLDRVLTQLGMVSERGLAEALAELVGASLVRPADYPEAPLFPDRLKPKFLRKSHALPISDTPDGIILAMADPLDEFVRSAVVMVLGRPVVIAVAIPIEL